MAAARTEREDQVWTEKNCLDLSRRGLTEFPNEDFDSHSPGWISPHELRSLQIHHNFIGILPPIIQQYSGLVILDISNNGMSHICEELGQLTSLQTLVAKNNNLDNDSIPKSFSELVSLTAVNLGGNKLTEFPVQLILMNKIERLFLGSNRITQVPGAIESMQSLQVLNLGDNHLETIPAEMGALVNLTTLNLACNHLRSLPPTLIKLHQLRSLSLHNNRLSTLPPEIVSINLVELSLRNNPLVIRFVQDLTYQVPSLLELAGRTIKLKKLPVRKEALPPTLHQYLQSAHECVNPRCKGVFFDSKVEHVKFVDFCGKYKLPLLQYLCSPKCTDNSPFLEASSDSESDEELAHAKARMKQVLLG